MGVRGCHPPFVFYFFLFLFFSVPSSSLPQSLLRVPFARLRREEEEEEVEEKGALNDYSAGKDSFEKVHPAMHARNGEEFPEIREGSSSISEEEGRNYRDLITTREEKSCRFFGVRRFSKQEASSKDKDKTLTQLRAARIRRRGRRRR